MSCVRYFVRGVFLRQMLLLAVLGYLLLWVRFSGWYDGRMWGVARSVLPQANREIPVLRERVSRQFHVGLRRKDYVELNAARPLIRSADLHGMPAPWFEVATDDSGCWPQQIRYTFFNPLPPIIVLSLAFGVPYLRKYRRDAANPPDDDETVWRGEPLRVRVVLVLVSAALGGLVFGWIGVVVWKVLYDTSPEPFALEMWSFPWLPTVQMATGWVIGGLASGFIFRALLKPVL